MEKCQELATMFREDQKLQAAAVIVGVVVVFGGAGFGSLSIVCILSSLFGGAFFAHWLFTTTDGQFLFSMALNWLSAKGCSIEKKTSTVDEVEETEKIRRMPWEGLTLPASLNQSVEGLLNELIEQYVNNWYESGISSDRAFLNEIRYQLRFACARLVRKLHKFDIAQFVAEDVLPSASIHLTRVATLEKKIKDDLSANVPRSLLEAKVSEVFGEFHTAMASRQREAEYLREVADFLIPRLLDDTRLAGRSYDDDSPTRSFIDRNERAWPSQTIRNFIRELVTNALLLPVVDIIAQPDTINYWLTLLFDDCTIEEQITDDETERVEFLKGLSEITTDNVPDSLLQLKLSEILRDTRLYSIFNMYLNDVRGPAHELKFLAETTRIHESMQRKSESSSQITYDIWQLFGHFVHESAPEKVNFDKKIVQEYRSAVESNDLEKLDRIIETSYQIVYQRMQTEHVVLFCQSECFLGYLCGSPPVCISELIDRSQEKRASVSEKTFSLSQLKAKVRKVLTSISDEAEDVPPPTIETSLSSPSLMSTESSNIPSPGIVPVIDISDDSCTRSQESPVEESIAASERVEQSSAGESCGLVLDSDARDLNTWRVAIGKVAPLRDSLTEKNSERTIYVFVIDVERPDAKQHETRRWSIHRSFNEFYVLESKLNEFHGDSLRFSALPPRKAFVTKDRPFMEQHRLIFSTFLSTLCKQRVLNRSELLLMFLSSNEEFRDNLMLSDLNPWKVVKKMPGKLSREKGQNLKPFLLKMLAGALVSEPNERIDKKEDKPNSDQSSIDSAFEAQPNTFATNSIYSSVFGNNLASVCNVGGKCDRIFENWSRSATDSILLVIFQLFKTSSTWMFDVLGAMRMLFKNTIDMGFYIVLGRVLKKSLSTSNLVYLVQHVQYTLFVSDEPLPTEQEKQLREELAKRRTIEYLQNIIGRRIERFAGRDSFKRLIASLVDALQYPRLNKQLFYVLLDEALVKMFPELEKTDR